MNRKLLQSFLNKKIHFPSNLIKHSFSQTPHRNSPQEKKTAFTNAFVSRASIQEQARSIIKNYDQFYENREKPKPEEQKNIQEEHLQQLLNKMILKREFFNDFIGVSLKTLSFLTATSRFIKKCPCFKSRIDSNMC